MPTVADAAGPAAPVPPPAAPPAAPSAPPPAPAPVLRPVPLLDRERSILAFNRRVLAQAERADVPLLERLRYLTIVSSNLDEFFEVRVADLIDVGHSGADAPAPPRSGATDLRALAAEAQSLVGMQYALLNDGLMPALRAAGIVVLNHAERNAAQRQWVRRFFRTQVQPLLVPLSLDPSHPFPQVANKSLNFIARLDGRDAYGRANRIAIVKVPRVLPRVIRLPDALCPGQQGFVLLTSVIRAHLAELFPGRTVEAFSQFRVTRDSDLDVETDDITNLRQALRRGLKTRHFGRAIRLEVVATCPAALHDFLLQQFELPPEALYRVNGPVNLVRLNQLIDQADDQAGGQALRFPRYEPSWPEAQWPRAQPVFDRLRQGDVLLHHPFESFEPVIEFLRQAVADPQVLAIKQTIYRTGEKSAPMELLIEAAQRGKEVLAVVELKARFDEEANINWAERLEAAGAQVVYGVVGLKTHAKMLLVTRRERGALRRYVHLSTGNYNPRTATLYTDAGMLSADPELCADADRVFLQLASQTRGPGPRQLVTAPLRMQPRILQLIAQTAGAARAGLPARIVAKVNALTDPGIIDALVRAARDGVPIDLIVRGACRLPPGLPGLTDRIRVRSVVGRFLEHSRVLYFRWGRGDRDEVLYLSSADWMSRNLFGRVEIAWPVRDPLLRQRAIDELLVPYLHDRCDAWALGADGQYRRIADDGPCAQRALMQRLGGPTA